ncbi:MAG: hypothetical protein QNJ40_22990 [Xanthomonadales bacterium]|nr:hypothetical protein [Xanthomonadales bacterium]
MTETGHIDAPRINTPALSPGSPDMPPVHLAFELQQHFCFI